MAQPWMVSAVAPTPGPGFLKSLPLPEHGCIKQTGSTMGCPLGKGWQLPVSEERVWGAWKRSLWLQSDYQEQQVAGGSVTTPFPFRNPLR